MCVCEERGRHAWCCLRLREAARVTRLALRKCCHGRGMSVARACPPSTNLESICRGLALVHHAQQLPHLSERARRVAGEVLVEDADCRADGGVLLIHRRGRRRGNRGGSRRGAANKREASKGRRWCRCCGAKAAKAAKRRRCRWSGRRSRRCAKGEEVCCRWWCRRRRSGASKGEARERRGWRRRGRRWGAERGAKRVSRRRWRGTTKRERLCSKHL